MTGTDLAEPRAALGLSQAELAAKLGRPTNTVARWERGELAIEAPETLDLALKWLEHLARSRGVTTRLQRETLSRAGRKRDHWEPADDDWLRAHPEATHAQAAAQLGRTLYAVRTRRRVLAGKREDRSAVRD
jgi:transcriptional regulator with XRE-family HTH domain